MKKREDENIINTDQINTDQINTVNHTDVTHLQKIRKKKQQKRNRMTIIAIIVSTVFFAYLGGIFAPSISFLSEALSSIKIAAMKGDGWPVASGTADVIVAEELAGGAAILDDDDLVIYSSMAKELRRIPHGFADPAISTANTRVCLYNRGGTDLKVESRDRTLFSRTFEKSIFTAKMADNGNLAVATKSQRYLSEITVFDSSFNEIYYCYFADSYPMNISFSNNGKYMAVTMIDVKDGNFGAKVELYNLSNDKKSITIELPNVLPLQMHYISSSKLLIVNDKYSAIYDTKTGQETAKYDYNSKKLLTADFNANNLALAFGSENHTNVTTCVIVDMAMQKLSEIIHPRDARGLMLSSNSLLVLDYSSVTRYKYDGTIKSTEQFETKAEFLIPLPKPLVITSKEILQLD